jgi:hypothetical protein
MVQVNVKITIMIVLLGVNVLKVFVMFLHQIVLINVSLDVERLILVKEENNAHQEIIVYKKQKNVSKLLVSHLAH